MSKVDFYNRLVNNSSGKNPFKPKNYSPAMKKILSDPDTAKSFIQFMSDFSSLNPNNKLSDLVEGAQEQGVKPITIDRLKAVVRFLNEGSDPSFRAMNKGVSGGNEINVIFVEKIQGLKDFVDKFKADSKKESKEEIEVMAGGEMKPMEEEKEQPKKGNLRKSTFDKVDEEMKKELKKEEEDKEEEEEEIKVIEVDENGQPLGTEEEKKEKIEEIKKERRDEKKEDIKFDEEFNVLGKELEVEKLAKGTVKNVMEEALTKIKILKEMKEEESDLDQDIINEKITKLEEEIRTMEQTSQPTKEMELMGTGSQEKEVPIKDVPSSVIPLPDERKSAEFKTENQLLEDINYFFKTYEPIVKDSLPRYEKIIKISDDKIRLRDLKDLHRRLVALIGDTDKKDEFKLGISTDGKTVGIILNADKYLDEKINMILLEKITNGLKPEDLLVNVERPEDKTDSKRVGSYELTKGRSGILSASRAPVYRSIPSTAPEDVRQDKRRFGPIELKSLPSQEWNQVNAAKKMVRLEDIGYSERDRKPDRLKIYL